MTRDSGQLTRPQALGGLLLIVAVAAGIVTGLALLLEREDSQPPLEAPAEPAGPVPCPDPAGIDQQEPPLVPADDLIACPADYDGKRVRYRGEVVRAVLRRGDTAWVQLNDDLYGLDLGPLPEHRTAVGGNSGLPVAIPASAVDAIQHVGDSRHHGDVLQVTGRFLRADPLDAGGPSIRAEQVRVLTIGRPIQHPTDPARATVAGVVSMAALIVFTLARLRARNR